MTKDTSRRPDKPIDPIVGMRVGGLSGVLIGTGLFLLTGFAWLILAGAILGGIVGYFWERRQT